MIFRRLNLFIMLKHGFLLNFCLIIFLNRSLTNLSSRFILNIRLNLCWGIHLNRELNNRLILLFFWKIFPFIVCIDFLLSFIWVFFWLCVIYFLFLLIIRFRHIFILFFSHFLLLLFYVSLIAHFLFFYFLIKWNYDFSF